MSNPEEHEMAKQRQGQEPFVTITHQPEPGPGTAEPPPPSGGAPQYQHVSVGQPGKPGAQWQQPTQGGPPPPPGPAPQYGTQGHPQYGPPGQQQWQQGPPVQQQWQQGGPPPPPGPAPQYGTPGQPQWQQGPAVQQPGGPPPPPGPAPHYGTPGQPQWQQGPPGQPQGELSGPQGPPMNDSVLPQINSAAGDPPGLEYLAQVDQLLIKQLIDILEVATGMDCQNKYRILNSVNQDAFFVQEEFDFSESTTCCINRGSIFHVMDNMRQEVLRLERPFKCCSGCCWCADNCCSYPIFIKDSQGQTLGTMGRANSGFAPHFGIWDAHDMQVFDIWGPACPCQAQCCTDDIDYPIKTVKGDQLVGNIAKQWSGMLQETYTNANNFNLSFPIEMSVTHKALLLASVFLIDITLYESRPANKNK